MGKGKTGGNKTSQNCSAFLMENQQKTSKVDKSRNRMIVVSGWLSELSIRLPAQVMKSGIELGSRRDGAQMGVCLFLSLCPAPLARAHVHSYSLSQINKHFLKRNRIICVL